MKIVKPGHVYVVSACLIFIVAAKIIFSHFLHPLETKSIKNLPFEQFNDIKISKNLLLPDSDGGSDPFIKGDFLDKKFLQLVSLTQLACNPILSNSKEVSSSTTTDFSYLLDELKIVINVKNFYSRSMGCKEIATIQVEIFLA